MAKICADEEQAKRLREMGFTGADMYCTPDGGAANFPICSSEGESDYSETWSLPALIKLLPESITYLDGYGRCFFLIRIIKEDRVEYHPLRTSDILIKPVLSSPKGELVDAVFLMLWELLDKGCLDAK